MSIFQTLHLEMADDEYPRPFDPGLDIKYIISSAGHPPSWATPGKEYLVRMLFIPVEEGSHEDGTEFEVRRTVRVV